MIHNLKTTRALSTYKLFANRFTLFFFFFWGVGKHLHQTGTACREMQHRLSVASVVNMWKKTVVCMQVNE